MGELVILTRAGLAPCPGVEYHVPVMAMLSVTVAPTACLAGCNRAIPVMRQGEGVEAVAFICGAALPVFNRLAGLECEFAVIEIESLVHNMDYAINCDEVKRRVL